LVKGVVRIYKADPRGKEVTITYLCPVSLVAEVANLTHFPYPANAEFETDGVVLQIDYSQFESQFLKNPEICFSIVQSLLAKIKVIENAFSENFILDATSRVAKFLYEDEELFNQLKHTKIASLLNLTPETFSRVIKKFKNLGILEKRDNKYVVKNKEKLKEFFS
jgi:CRP/FNR family transcriptional regulator